MKSSKPCACAVHARELGYAVVDIAAILGVSEETVSRWCSRYEHDGQEALPGDRTGRPVGSGCLLDEQQQQRLQQLIDGQSPQQLAIPSALWTRPAVQELIRQQVGLRLPIRTVGVYLQRWGYTPQQPVRKAYKQDPRPWRNGWNGRIRRSRGGPRRKAGRSTGGIRPACARRANTVGATPIPVPPRS